MFELRSHQLELVNILGRIRTGEPITKIIASITPGGGKSSYAPLIYEHLAHSLGWRIAWIVPRDPLRLQGIEDFNNSHLLSNKVKLRMGTNVPGGLSRGHDVVGYATTYQGITAAPELHLTEMERQPYVLILDECHHIPLLRKGDESDESAYYGAIAPLVERAKLVILMSGTMERHDGHRIAFLPYIRSEDGSMVIDMTPNENTATISYPLTAAVRENATVEIIPTFIDARARWLKHGKEVTTESLTDLSKEMASGALRTVAETECAEEIISRCYHEWLRYKVQFPAAKMLVVAPTIEMAKSYQRYMRSELGVVAQIGNPGPLIAHSEAYEQARDSIERVRNGSGQILVTVGMAHEGLNIPSITHIAILTNIRSRPWLAQCIARCNRVTPGKNRGYIYLPADDEAIRIVNDIFADVRSGPTAGSGGSSGVDSPGGAPSSVQPLSAEVTTLRGQDLSLSAGNVLWLEQQIAASQSPLGVVEYAEALIANSLPIGEIPVDNLSAMPTAGPNEIEDVLKKELNRMELEKSLGRRELLLQIRLRIKQLFGPRDLMDSSQLAQAIEAVAGM